MRAVSASSLCLQVASFSLTVDIREQVLMLRTEVQEGSHALESLHDVISSGFRRLAKQNSLHQAK